MIAYDSFDRVWLLTWTTYGTWLPGDERGFVSPKFESSPTEPRCNTPGTDYDTGRPELKERASALLKGPPVFLRAEHARVLRTQFEETAQFRHWTLVAGAIMANHVHLVVGVPGDPEPATLLQSFKSYGSRALNRTFGKPLSGTWWTEQGSKRKVGDAQHFASVVNYVLRQHAPLMVWRAGDVSPLPPPHDPEPGTHVPPGKDNPGTHVPLVQEEQGTHVPLEQGTHVPRSPETS